MKLTKLNPGRLATHTILTLLAILAFQAPLTAKADDNGNGNGNAYGHYKTRHHVLCLSMTCNGACLTCEGKPGETYCIEATSDLAHPNWQPICDGTVAPHGQIAYTDADATNCPSRFYRVIWTEKGNHGNGNQGKNSQN